MYTVKIDSASSTMIKMNVKKTQKIHVLKETTWDKWLFMHLRSRVAETTRHWLNGNHRQQTLVSLLLTLRATRDSRRQRRISVSSHNSHIDVGEPSRRGWVSTAQRRHCSTVSSVHRNRHVGVGNESFRLLTTPAIETLSELSSPSRPGAVRSTRQYLVISSVDAFTKLDQLLTLTRQLVNHNHNTADRYHIGHCQSSNTTSNTNFAPSVRQRACVTDIWATRLVPTNEHTCVGDLS